MGRHLVRSITAAGVPVVGAFGLLELTLPAGGGAGTYATASAAIALAVAAAGLSAGLLAVALSAAVVAFAHLPPLATLQVDHPEELLALGLFSANGLVVAAAVSLVRQRRALSRELGRTPAHEAPLGLTRPTPPIVRATHLVEPLTEREVEVLASLAAGCSNEDIAGSLFVSVNTVKTHLKNVYGKLGVTSRTQATARALELGIIGAPVPGESDQDERDAA